MRKKQFFLWLSLLMLGLIFGGFFSLVRAEVPTVRINSDEISTQKRKVLLSLVSPSDTDDMRISENVNFSESEWMPFARRKYWTLTFGQGIKTLYVQFRSRDGRVSPTYSDSIRLSGEPIKVDAVLNSGNEVTRSLAIPIRLTYSAGVESVAITPTKNPGPNDYHPVAPRIQWTLSPGEGQKKLYITFRDNNANTATIERTIRYTAPKNTLPAGRLLRSEDGSLYYFGRDSRLHLFPNILTYHSYYSDFSDVQSTSNAALREYQIGLPVCMRAGTWLLQFGTESRVYAVEPGCQLRQLRSATEAYVLYGEDWSRRVVDLPASYKRHYEVQPLSEEAEDIDRDGVNRFQEERYGISDSREDSDRDDVSDYEEIYYWRTNPARTDTDGNGVTDGEEIRRGDSPNGIGELTTIPADTYIFPSGSVVWFSWDDLQYYYTIHDNVFAYLARSKGNRGFPDHNLSPDFVLNPPYAFEVTKVFHPPEEEIFTFSRPHIMFNSTLQPL